MGVWTGNRDQVPLQYQDRLSKYKYYNPDYEYKTVASWNRLIFTMGILMLEILRYYTEVGICIL